MMDAEPKPIRNSQFAIRNGFTLVEVLVAAAVLAIGISAGVRTLGAMTRASAAAADRATAVRLAGECLALLETQLVAQAVGAQAVEENSTGDGEGQFESEPRFQWQQQVITATEPGLLEATVTVIWHDAAVPRSYSVTTYLPDPNQEQQPDEGAAQ